MLARVVVDEPDGAQPELRVAQQLTQDEPPAITGADDEHRPRVAARTEAAQTAVVDRSGKQPDPREETRDSRK